MNEKIPFCMIYYIWMRILDNERNDKKLCMVYSVWIQLLGNERTNEAAYSLFCLDANVEQ